MSPYQFDDNILFFLNITRIIHSRLEDKNTTWKSIYWKLSKFNSNVIFCSHLFCKKESVMFNTILQLVFFLYNTDTILLQNYRILALYTYLERITN